MVCTSGGPELLAGDVGGYADNAAPLITVKTTWLLVAFNTATASSCVTSSKLVSPTCIESRVKSI